MLNQIFAKSLRRLEENASYEDEGDPFKPLDFSNIEECPHELQYDIWEEHALDFDNNQDPSKFFELFVNFIASYNLIHGNEIMKMFTLSIRRHLGY